MTGFSKIPGRERHSHTLASSEHHGSAPRAGASPSNQQPEAHLHRNLNNRHIQLIAIGGAIACAFSHPSRARERAQWLSLVHL